MQSYIAHLKRRHKKGSMTPHDIVATVIRLVLEHPEMKKSQVIDDLATIELRMSRQYIYRCLAEVKPSIEWIEHDLDSGRRED